MKRSSEAVLDDVVQPEPVLAEVIHWIGPRWRPSTGIILCGKPGTCKSFLASAIANEFMLRDLSACVTTSKAMFSSLHPNGGGRIEGYAFPDLLMLDDLAAEKASEFTNTTLCDIIGLRYEARRPTIITTNLHPEPVQGYIGERTWSRLAGARQLRLAGPTAASIRSKLMTTRCALTTA
jgi:DNA replication protein DnaC